MTVIPTIPLPRMQRRSHAESVATNLLHAVALLKVAHTNLVDPLNPAYKDALTLAVHGTILTEIARLSAAYAAGLAEGAP